VSLNFVWLYEQNVLVVFFYSGLDGLTSLSDVHMTTLIGDTLNVPGVFSPRLYFTG
jgi:hypothetical protein